MDAAQILALLPQTQCTRCGYPDCAAYADAIAHGAARINQCPPGGAEGIRRLAALTGEACEALDPACGVEAPRTVVFIDEDWCIGCTLCLEACPTDAIVGSNKRMHTVLEAFCTGCELCIPACPVDCIVVEEASDGATGWQAWSQAQADQARERYAASRQRKAPRERQPLPLAALPEALALPHAEASVADVKRAMVQAALARARTRLPRPADGTAGPEKTP